MNRAWGLVLRPFVIVRGEPEFRKLWAGDLISKFGTGITRLALPLTAAVMLGASPVDMGILTAAGTLPNLLIGLPAGVVVDRLPRRLILVVADVGRAFLLVSIPIAALLGMLGLEQLYMVAFLEAALDIFFDLAAISFVPVVLSRKLLIEGNTLLTINGQIAKVAGPSLGGILIQALTAPVAIVLDALSYLASAACTAAVQVSEAPLVRRAICGGWWKDLAEGLRLVWRDPVLRSIAGASILGQLAGAVQGPLLILYLARELGLSPTALGGILAVSGVAAVPGSLLARPIARKLGEGPATATGTLFVSLGMLLMPFANGPQPMVVGILASGQILAGIGIPIYAINQLTVRQAAVPDHLQGRANATRRFLMFGATPLSAIVSGCLGQAVGLRPTLLVAASLMGLALLWTVRSPLWILREAASG